MVQTKTGGLIIKTRSMDKILGNHQKCWLWGRNPIQETLNRSVWPILELYLADSLEESELAASIQKAEETAIPYFIKKRGTIWKNFAVTPIIKVM